MTSLVPMHFHRLHYKRSIAQYTARFCFLIALALLGKGAESPACALDAADFGYNNQRIVGTRPLLVILMQDSKYPAFRRDLAYYKRLAAGPLGGAAPGEKSIFGYYAEVSNGNFAWLANAVGPFRQDMSRRNGGENSSESALRAEAIRAAAEQGGINFGIYDRNQDGSVTADELTVLIVDNWVRPGETGSTHGTTRGADSVRLDTQKVTVQLGSVSAVGEGASFATMNHELCHILGTTLEMYAWPQNGLGFHQELTLMAGTLYSDADNQQTYHPDAWLKIQYGWVQPRLRDMNAAGAEQIESPQFRTRQGLSNKSPIILYDPRHGTSEFFILEYRSKTGGKPGSYDADVASDGLAIWQVRHDGTKRPVLIPSEAKPNLNIWTVFNRAAPSWVQGGSSLYTQRDGVIMLKWIDGTDTGVRLKVGAPTGSGELLPVSWSPGGQGESLGGRFSGPVVANSSEANRLDIVGIGLDGSMYHKSWNGRQWLPEQNWENLGGKFNGAIAITSSGPSLLDVVGRGGDGALYHRRWNGSQWFPAQNWERLGGKFHGAIAITAWGPNRLDIVGIGTDSAIYHKSWDGRQWGPSLVDWERLGGKFSGDIAMTSWGPNRLDIVGRGLDGAIYHRAWNGSQWAPADWERLGGQISGAIAMTSWGPNRLDVVGRGLNGAIFHKSWNGSEWRPLQGQWEELNGRFDGSIAMTSWGPNRLDIVGRGLDGAAYHKSWNGRQWTPSPANWDRLGGEVSGSIAMTSWGPNRLDIVERGVDGILYHKYWNGSVWVLSQLN